ncbi:MAG: hypothetical protein AAF495_29180 [Pseudomonadota bacterium]
MDETKEIAHSGLTWPNAYLPILPTIEEQWGVRGHLYLSRKLSGGMSGALVFAADVESHSFTGQAILKFDQADDSGRREEHESERHCQAFADAPDYAQRHLPRLLHSAHHGDQIAVLSAIAGQGLEYAKPWQDCPFELQLRTARQLSRGVLEEWNGDYRLSAGLRKPPQLIAHWLDYRLDPARGGRIHDFLANTCCLAPDEPSFTFEGHWYPNPLAFALGATTLPERLQLRAITGRGHGDLHGLNVLVADDPGSEPWHYLIDLADYRRETFLFYDQAFFELAFLLTSRQTASPASWEAILSQLSYFHSDAQPPRLRADDLGLLQLVKALREEVNHWIGDNEPDRLSYMESQYLLARVAAGLNFCHKQISEETRRMAFIYAASNLKDYLKLNHVEWTKHGPPVGLKSGAVETPRASSEAAARDGSGAAAHSAPKRRRTGVAALLEELSQRHLVKVAGAYIIVAWLGIQAASALEASFGLPHWTDALIMTLFVLGFPVACLVAWSFELGPSGLERRKPASGRDPPRGRGPLDVLLVAGVVAIVAVTLGRSVMENVVEPSPMAVGEHQRTSIAVLPFRSLSQDVEDDRFADGLTIEIMSTLAHSGEFRISGQSSAFQYKDRPENLRQIGEALGVAYILDGSVRHVDDELRIEAQLVEADDGFLVWSDIFVEKIEDIFLVQEKIANAIGDALMRPLGIAAAALQTERTDNPEAYSLFLKGFALLKQRGPGLSEAAELLRESVEIDPNFAAGWAALSLVYNVLPSYVKEVNGFPVLPAPYYRRAQQAALKAQEIAPDLAIVHYAQANIYRRDRQWSQAEDQYRLALDQQPANDEVMEDYSELLAVVGHQSQAIAMAAQMLELDPLNPLYQMRDAQTRWLSDPSAENVERLIALFEAYPEFQEINARPIIGYMFKTGQVERLEALIDACASCDQGVKESLLGMIEATRTLSPQAVFETYKDTQYIGYLFLEAIGGPELVLEAFQYYSRTPARPTLVFTVPWSVLGSIGQDEAFKFLMEEQGIVDYWRERGWPERCRPLDGDDFECT